MGLLKSTGRTKKSVSVRREEGDNTIEGVRWRKITGDCEGTQRKKGEGIIGRR